MRSLLKRIFFITATSSLIIGGLFIFPQYGKGYDDQTTHPALTDEIVDFYNLSFTNKLTDEEKEWIVEGSINEDIPPRWINHFYDPTTGEGWKSENLGEVPPITLQIFSKIFLNATTETVSSKNWVHNELLQAKYTDYGGNRTWENAIRRYVNGDKEYAYRTLGDVLHLLEDKTVPDHTRNDTHAHEGSLVTGDGGSPYEDYSSNYTRGNLVIAPDLKKENKSPIIFTSLDEYFDYLAKYSNNNFFSEHTINSEKYRYPKILREGNGYAYGQDQHQNETILSEVRAETNSDLGTTKTYTLNNKQVLSSYFSRLSREAVLSGAGVIDLFYEEVAKAEKDKNLIKEEPTISWWQKMRSPGYGVIIPTINATMSGVVWAYDTSITVINKTVDVTTSIINKVVDVTTSIINKTVDVTTSIINKTVDVTTSIINKTVDVTTSMLSKANTSQGASLIDAVRNEKVVGNPIQGSTLDTARAEPAPVEVPSESAPAPIIKAIQGQPLDNTPVVKTSQSATQPLVFVGGAMPIVAAPAPVAQDTTSQVQNTDQATTTADTTAPVITINGENSATVFVGDPYTDAGATALDETDGARTVSSLSNVDIFTAGSYAVTYTTSDSVGNMETSTRIVNVVHDETMLASSDLNGNAIPDSEEDEVVVSAGASLSAGEYSFDTLKITASSTLTLMGTTTSERTFKGVKIVARNIIVDADSSISADMQGYARASGPGKSSNPTGGASHGGVGAGNTATSTYGSTLAPIDMGSGGNGYYSNAYGGGAIKLVVGDTLTINGTISANGGETSSGGSIYLVANTLAGNGVLRAEGGGSYWAGQYIEPGAGGRISINSFNSSFSGSMKVPGGCRWSSGFLITCSGDGTVGFFDMTNNDFYARAPWQFLSSDGPFTFNRIIIENGASVGIESGAQITANELALSGASSLSVGSGSTIAIPAISVDGQSSLTFSGNETLTVGTLSIMGTSTVSVLQGVPLVLSARDITISAGSSIDVDNKGYAPASGLGKSLNPLGGASHGGIGAGNTATSTYGSAFVPIDMGSGGNGHSSNAYGGGAVKLTASGTLTIDGVISANGGETASGGSIYLVAGTIIGTGTLRVEGGGTYWSGQYIEPGAGGRIALDSSNQAFSGSMSAVGRCRSSSGFIIACSEDGTVVYGASIGSFDFAALSPSVSGTIDERAHTISLAVPHGTDVAMLAPTITVSRGATVAPSSGEAQDFTIPILYIVTSATSSTSTYAVTVTVSPEPDTTPPIITISAYDGITSTSTPITVTATTSEGILNAESHTFTENGSFDFIATDDAGNTATSTVMISNIDTIPPSIISYTFNGTVGDITVDFATTTSVSLVLTASENVDWVSIKIENTTNASNYKIFYDDGGSCVNGTTSCAKTWDGTMSHGTLVDGTYRIKVKIEDIVGNLYQDYLSPYVITVASP